MSALPRKDSGLKDGLRLRGGVYHFRFMVHGELKTGSTGCRDLRSAQAYLMKLRSSLALESVDIRTHAKATFQEAFDLYLKIQIPRLAPKTVYLFRSNLEHHWSHFKDALLRDMQEHLDDLLPVLAEKMKPGSQRLIFARLRAILEFARKRRLHQTPLEYPCIDVPRDPKQVLNDEQLEVFFAQVDRLGNLHQQILIRSLFYLGLRVSEAQRLAWDDYDDMALTYRMDERQKNGKILYLPVLPEMACWFAKLTRKPGELMCPGKWGQHNTRYTDRIIKKASLEMGLKIPMTHHRLRASLSTSLLRKGVPLAVVQRILRHADPTTTTRYYWEEEVQDLREGIMVLSRPGGKDTPT